LPLERPPPVPNFVETFSWASSLQCVQPPGLQFGLWISIGRKTPENVTYLDWIRLEAEIANRNNEASFIRLGS
jgi:hypothetical protein